jgi:hypothetical protein
MENNATAVKQKRKPKVVVPIEASDVQTKKKKRNIDPHKMTYLKAFSIWKQKNNYSGLSPKKYTDEYN